MESRSIDTAKDASIDLMTLNKKIVNMRSTVKRSKTHIINKLTKNIENLKKKKGTEQEKEKNLQKAQRYLQEIQSIRILREDKISKYSIGNVSTYEEVSKKTLSSGARALARLAEHHLIKEVVKKFREEHNDWRDLAAFMLIQQTGRKFKSQKNKKILTRMENINASKLLTDAYTQGRFRIDGFKNLEDKSEKKRKKKNKDKEQREETTDELPDIEKNAETNERLLLKKNKDNSDELTVDKVKKQKLYLEKQGNKSNVGNEDDLGSDNEEKIKEKLVTGRKLEQTILEKSQNKDTSDSDKQIIHDESNEEDNEQEEGEDMEDEVTSPNESDDSEDGEEEEYSDDDDEVEDGEGEEPESEELSNQLVIAPDSPPEPEESLVKTVKKDECVIKQLDMGDENSNSDDDSDSVSSDTDDSSTKADDNRVTKKNEEEMHKRSKKGKTVPDFLIKGEGKKRKLPRDPFFEGSDMEDDFNDFEEDQTYEDGGEDDADIQEKFKGNKKTTKSLFYKPGDEKRLAQKKEFHNTRRDHFDSGRGGGRGRGRGGLDNRGRGRGGLDNRGRGEERYDRRRSGDDRRGRGGFGDTSGRSYKPGRERRQQFDGGDNDKQFSNSSDRSKASITSQAGSSSVSKPSEKLHPSWEASRKRKAEQAGIKAFSGTKITFDDDD